MASAPPSGPHAVAWSWGVPMLMPGEQAAGAMKRWATWVAEGAAPVPPNNAAEVQSRSDHYWQRELAHRPYSRDAGPPTLVYCPARDGASPCRANVWVAAVEATMCGTGWLERLEVPRFVVLLLLCLPQSLSCCCYCCCYCCFCFCFCVCCCDCCCCCCCCPRAAACFAVAFCCCCLCSGPQAHVVITCIGEHSGVERLAGSGYAQCVRVNVRRCQVLNARGVPREVRWAQWHVSNRRDSSSFSSSAVAT